MICVGEFQQGYNNSFGFNIVGIAISILIYFLLFFVLDRDNFLLFVKMVKGKGI